LRQLTTSYLEDGERLDVSGVRDVRTSAKIDERAASVDGAGGAVRDALVDEVLLVFAVFEHLEELFLGHLQTLKGLLLLDDGAGQRLQRLLVLLLNNFSGEPVSRLRLAKGSK
jgi:hypothetical protein